jgi:hypothetical protein
MFRKPLALALVFSCVILSGFDLLEDLRLESDHSAYSKSGRLPSRTWIQHASLANNILESGASAAAFFILLFPHNLSHSATHPVSTSHRVSELYKLHRVFLI